MSRVILRRRPDGILQIRPRPFWLVLAGSVPAAIAALLLACTFLMAALAVALVRFPALVFLVMGSVTLALAAMRFGLTAPPMAEVHARNRPPGKAS